jgi:hypothetical protein
LAGQKVSQIYGKRGIVNVILERRTVLRCEVCHGHGLNVWRPGRPLVFVFQAHLEQKNGVGLVWGPAPRYLWEDWHPVRVELGLMDVVAPDEEVFSSKVWKSQSFVRLSAAVLLEQLV